MVKSKYHKIRPLAKTKQDIFRYLAKVIEEIFLRHDKDNDGALNDSELDSFAITCNGKPFDKESKAEIKDNFDVDSKNNLTQKGFFEMYNLQTNGDPGETLKDLKKHGYDDNLNLKVGLDA